MSGMGIDDIVFKDDIKKLKNNIYNIEQQVLSKIKLLRQEVLIWAKGFI